MQAIAYTQVTDIALTPGTGDWLVGPSPDGLDLQLIGDGPGLQQAVTIALKFFLGEWFLDQSAGTPWFQAILIKNPNPAAIQAIIRKVILAVPGITSVSAVTITPVSAARAVAITWQATGDTGELVSGTVQQQF
jgi:hypothetical protein